MNTVLISLLITLYFCGYIAMLCYVAESGEDTNDPRTIVLLFFWPVIVVLGILVALVGMARSSNV
jgi:hypothetical protein